MSKAKDLRKVLLEKLDKLSDQSPNKTNIENLADKLIELASLGDRGAMNELLNRVYGKPEQNVKAEVGLRMEITLKDPETNEELDV